MTLQPTGQNCFGVCIKTKYQTGTWCSYFPADILQGSGWASCPTARKTLVKLCDWDRRHVDGTSSNERLRCLRSLLIFHPRAAKLIIDIATNQRTPGCSWFFVQQKWVWSDFTFGSWTQNFWDRERKWALNANKNSTAISRSVVASWASKVFYPNPCVC